VIAAIVAVPLVDGAGVVVVVVDVVVSTATCVVSAAGFSPPAQATSETAETATANP